MQFYDYFTTDISFLLQKLKIELKIVTNLHPDCFARTLFIGLEQTYKIKNIPTPDASEAS